MSDFAQRGLISTLQKLHPNSDSELIAALAPLPGSRPVAVVIPCHGPDLAQPALQQIVREITAAPFVQRLILPINGASPEQIALARTIAAKEPERTTVLWTDSPIARPGLERLLQTISSNPVSTGKGCNVWAATGWLSKNEPRAIVAVQDCDVRTFDASQLARLLFAIAHPEMRYGFGKLYYSRLAGQMYGRLTRLFFFPLIQALTRTLGHQPLLDFLASFRYPLAGECALSIELARTLPLHPDWGLEIGMLCEVFRRTEPRDVCQVDAGASYDHRHQPLGDASHGLGRMAVEITQTLFAELETEGVQLTPPLLESIASSFEKESAEAVRRYRNLALINGIEYDMARETDTAGRFAQLLRNTTPRQAAFLPSWAIIDQSAPEEANDFLAASVLTL